MTAHLMILYPSPKMPPRLIRLTRSSICPMPGQGCVAPRAWRPRPPVMSDVSFPSLEALKACATSTGGQEALQHAAPSAPAAHQHTWW